MARLAWGILPLLLLSVVLVLVPSTVQAHPHHLQVGNDAIATERMVYDQQWVAQSFVPTSNFFLSRIALFVRDRSPSEPLSLEVRPDAGGAPGAVALRGTSVDGPSVAVWLDFDLGPYLQLEANRTYWIVASASAPQFLDGYGWWRSGSNTAYLPGTGALSPDGLNWTNDTEDYAFRVYGFHQPNLTFSVAASRTTVDAGQSFSFRVNMTNAGLGSASRVWVNVSLPAGLTYVADDAFLIGGVWEGFLRFRFTNLSAGPWSFRLTVMAATNVSDGAVAETTFAFEGTDHNGLSSTRSFETVPVTFRNPAPPGWGWLLGLVAIPIGGVLFLLVRRRLRGATVEEVFVVHQNGILLAHRSKTLTPDKDEDILTGMLKTVQEFVQEAFSTDQPLSMRGLHFAEFSILIEPGRTHHIAVVYRGKDDGTLAARAKELAGRIDARFGRTLESWNGDMREVRGLRDLLPILWGRRAQPDPARSEGTDRERPQDRAWPEADRGTLERGEPIPVNPDADEER